VSGKCLTPPENDYKKKKIFMPTYDYRCENCSETFEIFQSIKDEPEKLCPSCGHNTLKKLVSLPAGLIFKGTGFYQTDYKKKSSPATERTTSTETTSTTISDTKSDKKGTKKSPGKKKK